MLRKKLLIEFVIGICMLFSFLVYQSTSKAVIASPKNQIFIGDGLEITEDFYLNKSVKETSTEGVFEVSLRYTLLNESSLDPLETKLGIILDTSSSDVVQLKKSIRTLFEDYQQMLYLFTTNDSEMYESYGYNDVYVLSIPFNEKQNSLKDTIEYAKKTIDSPLIVFSNEYYEDEQVIHYTSTKKCEQLISDRQWEIVDELNSNVEFMTVSSNTYFYNYNYSQHKLSFDIVSPYFVEVSYLVRLNNENPDFDSSKAIDLSKQIYLKYYDYGVKYINFPTIQVFGYTSNVVLYNYSSLSNEAINGSSFLLKHHNNCNYCQSTIEINDFMASSDNDGKIIFKNVPSRHEYQLSQTKVNDRFMMNNSIYNVAVVYGECFIDGSKKLFLFDNMPKYSDALELHLEVVENNLYKDYPYELYYKVEASGTAPLPKQPIQQTNKRNIIQFDPIYFSKSGVYHYRISCMNKGIKANDIFVVVNVTSEYEQGKQKLNANVTYYNGQISNDNIITISK